MSPTTFPRFAEDPFDRSSIQLLRLGALECAGRVPELGTILTLVTLA
jgi:hypothetical protein